MNDANRFAVDAGELDAVIGDMERTEGELQQLTDDVERQIAALQEVWEGLAAEAQRAAQAEWEQGMREHARGAGRHPPRRPHGPRQLHERGRRQPQHVGEPGMNVRLDVDAAGYDSAADALSTANGTTATAFDDLVGDLGGFGGMGGDDKSSEDWVANYDPAARDTVLAIADLTTAWGNLARASASSGANHRDANAGSVYRGDGGATGSEATPDVREVSASTPPSALGADGGDMPDGWDLIVDHLQGWTWPSADVDRLRQAASSWRTAAGMIEYTPSDGASARSQLGSQKSPEIPQATRAIGDVERAAGDVATACRDLADSCDDYATQVETTRETIKGLLRDLLIEIAATAAVSALGSLVTFGGAAAAGAAVAVTRAIACARKIIKVLVALKGVRAVATAARSVSKIKGVQAVLRRYRSFRNMRNKPTSLKNMPKKGKPNSFGYDANGNRLPYTNSRPKYGDGQERTVFDRQARPDGTVRVLDDKNNPVDVTYNGRAPGGQREWNMGHLRGEEYHKLRDQFLSHRIDYDEFIRRYRDPDRYEVQHWLRNQKHMDEAP